MFLCGTFSFLWCELLIFWWPITRAVRQRLVAHGVYLRFAVAAQTHTETVMIIIKFIATPPQVRKEVKWLYSTGGTEILDLMFSTTMMMRMGGGRGTPSKQQRWHYIQIRWITHIGDVMTIVTMDPALTDRFEFYCFNINKKLYLLMRPCAFYFMCDDDIWRFCGCYHNTIRAGFSVCSWRELWLFFVTANWNYNLVIYYSRYASRFVHLILYNLFLCGILSTWAAEGGVCKVRRASEEEKNYDK